MNVNKEDLSDIAFVVAFAFIGLFALACGWVLDGDKLKDLGFTVITLALVLIYIVKSRAQERKHYKKIMDELKEMKKNG